jgi:hypothetical protein
VRPANFLVFFVSDEAVAHTHFRVFMIDFAESRLCENESDIEWGRAKNSQDEERAVVFVMKHKLKKVGFDLYYKLLGRFAKWAPTEAEEPRADHHIRLTNFNGYFEELLLPSARRAGLKN